MKETTKLVLMAVGAGVATNVLLGDRVAAMTSAYALPAAGAEGLGAAGAGYWAWKKKNKAAAIAAGALAGLLVSSVQGGLLTPPPAPPKAGSTPQSTMKTKPTGAALPSPSVGQGPGTVPLLPTTTTTLPGFNSVSGQIPPGAAVPAPNRPPTAAETQAYADYMAQELQQQQIAMAQQAAAMDQGGLPTTTGDTSGSDWFPMVGDQSGGVVRLGMGQSERRGGFGAGGSFRRGGY